ncbi:MAG: restriction endonuclease subunit S, partial [Chloroflexota bacterium]
MNSSEWKDVKLGEIANFKTGKLNSNAAENNGMYPFFTCSPETLRINSYSFDCEAILLAGNNANGIFALKYYRGKFNAYQRTYVITSNPEDVDIEYIYHQLTLKLQRLENISHGTATKYLTLPLLNEIEIKLPPLSTQHRIADILTALDEKIELNR